MIALISSRLSVPERRVLLPDPPAEARATRVDHVLGRGHRQQDACHRRGEAARFLARSDRRDPGLEQVVGVLVARPRLARVGVGRPQPGQRLDQRGVVDRLEPHLLHPVARVAPSVERGLDLIGDRTLGLDERVVGGHRPAVLAHPLGGRLERREQRVLIRQREALEAQRVHHAERLGGRLVGDSFTQGSRKSRTSPR